MSERLSFLLDLNAQGAIRGFEQVGQQADRNLKKAEDRIGAVGAQFTRVGAGMLATGGILAAGLFSMSDSASDLNESMNVVDLTFGSASASVQDWAKGAADSLGMSQRAANDAAAGFGGLLQNLGMTRGESIQTSKDLTQLAADMSSAFNTESADAVLAIGAALRGESEPIRRYNVFLSETAVDAKAAEMGLAEMGGEVSKNAELSARLAIIMEQTSRIHGDFANTADGAANAERRLAAQTENMKAAFGQAALVVREDAVGALNGLFEAFNSLPPAMQSTISGTALFGTGLLLVGGAAATVTGKVLTMLKTFKELRRAADTSESAMGTLNKMSGTAAKAGAAFGLLTTAVVLYSDMMGKARQSGEDFAAGVEQDAFAGVTSYEELTQKIAATRQGVDDLRGSTSAGWQLWDADKNTELHAGADALDAVADRQQMLADAADQLARQYNISRDSAVQFIYTQEQLGSEFSSGEQVLEEYAAATGHLTEEVNAQILPFDELQKAVAGYLDSMTSGIEIQMAFEAQVDKTIEALKENGLNYDLSSEAGRENMQAVMDLREQIVALYMEQYNLTGSTDEARVAALNSVIGFREQSRAAGISSHTVDDLITKLDLAATFDGIETDFNMRGIDPARAQVQGLAWDINNLPTHKRIFIETVQQVVGDFMSGDRAGRDLGMLPMAETGAVSSGGTTVHLTVNAGLGTDGQAVGEQIVEALMAYERSGGVLP